MKSPGQFTQWKNWKIRHLVSRFSLNQRKRGCRFMWDLLWFEVIHFTKITSAFQPKLLPDSVHFHSIMTNMCDRISFNGFIEIAFWQGVCRFILFCFFLFQGTSNVLHNGARIGFSESFSHPSFCSWEQTLQRLLRTVLLAVSSECWPCTLTD